MITEKQVTDFLKSLPKGTDSEVWRMTSACLTGLKDGMSPKEIASYYNVSKDFILDFMKNNNFESSKSEQGSRKKKQSEIFDYLKNNVNKVITPKIFCDTLNVSMPTFYNFLNANRGYFKKVKRGEFMIINPNDIRKEEK